MQTQIENQTNKSVLIQAVTSFMCLNMKRSACQKKIYEEKPRSIQEK
jgi:hypothetical protein